MIRVWRKTLNCKFLPIPVGSHDPYIHSRHHPREDLSIFFFLTRFLPIFILVSLVATHLYPFKMNLKKNYLNARINFIAYAIFHSCFRLPYLRCVVASFGSRRQYQLRTHTRDQNAKWERARMWVNNQRIHFLLVPIFLFLFASSSEFKK